MRCAPDSRISPSLILFDFIPLPLQIVKQTQQPQEVSSHLCAVFLYRSNHFRWTGLGRLKKKQQQQRNFCLAAKLRRSLATVTVHTIHVKSQVNMSEDTYLTGHVNWIKFQFRDSFCHCFCPSACCLNVIWHCWMCTRVRWFTTCNCIPHQVSCLESRD